jgi:hypothetical protein
MGVRTAPTCISDINVAIAKRANPRLAPFFRALPREFDAFERRGTSLILTDVENVLVGYHFDFTSIACDQRWLHVFAIPLYIPTEDLVLGYGYRVSKMPGYTVYAGTANQDLLNETIEVMIMHRNELEKWKTDPGLYSFLLDWGPASKMMYRGWWYEALIGAALLVNKVEEAHNHIESFISFYQELTTNSGGDPSFVEDQFRRIKAIQTALKLYCVEKALLILANQRSFSINALGINNLIK